MEHSTALAGTIYGLILLLLTAAVVRAVTKKIHFPFTIALVIAGMSLGWLSEHNVPGLAIIQQFELTPELILYVFIPTLIFESAIGLDAHLLKKNVLPIITLAIPGLLISTVAIGAIVYLVSGFNLYEAMLLGAILSATDPVAVIALFKQLGAPRRLTVLVEGESLLNDATSLVLARLLVGILMVGSFSSNTLLQGIADFFVVFVGGLLVGFGLGFLFSFILSRIRSDSFIEITLTTILAYCAFLIAEEGMHVSGIMATMAAGITLAGWGRASVSSDTRLYLDHFWEYLAFLANAVIFLMVGLLIDFERLAFVWDMILWVVLALLVSRAMVVFGLLPWVGRLPGGGRIEPAYQLVLYWGGLRGAIALAIVLSLPDFEHKDTFVAIVTGAVLFTLLVKGTTIEWLVKWLKLDVPPIQDQLARAEGLRDARQHALNRMPKLFSGGLVSAYVAHQLNYQCKDTIEHLANEIGILHQQLTEQEEYAILMSRCLAKEKSLYQEMYQRRHLSEWAFRELDQEVTAQLTSMRFKGELRQSTLSSFELKSLSVWLIKLFDALPGFSLLASHLRTSRTIRNYYLAWSQYLAALTVLKYLKHMPISNESTTKAAQRVKTHYEAHKIRAKDALDSMAEQFPSFVKAVQKRLGYQLILSESTESIHKAVEHGMLTEGLAHQMLNEEAHELDVIAIPKAQTLKLDIVEALKMIPLFRDIDKKHYQEIAAILTHITVSPGDTVICQGDVGDAMYIIARGVMRVYYADNQQEQDVATLVAGDYFGELALVYDEPRTASVKSITASALYVLAKTDLQKLMGRYPSLKNHIHKTASTRRPSNN